MTILRALAVVIPAGVLGMTAFGQCAVVPPASVNTGSAAYAQVIANDPFCCNVGWDALCQQAYDDLTGSPSCPVVPPASVDVTSLAYAQVIADDPFCCELVWDTFCQQAYAALVNDPGTPVTAGDCPLAVNVCTNINFQIDPNGIGALNEIPPLGSLANPDLQPGGGTAAWGTDNWGCLRNNELNSTWMIVNIQTGGSLEFVFGGLGTQSGFYDWIMYPYTSSTCSQVAANAIAPIRCNWNGVSFGGTGLAATLPTGGDPTNYEPPLNVVTGQQLLICFSNWSSVTTSVPLVFGGTAVVSCTPLPIELLLFDARMNGMGVLLHWTTASEMNSSHFDIERSADMVAWERKGTSQAAGTSAGAIDYAWQDDDPDAGTSYYRLRMVDLDGTFMFSPARSVSTPLNGPVCFPNPSDGSFFLQHVPEGTTIEVHDALGRRIPVALTVDGTNRIVRITTSEEGIYTVRIEQGSATIIERMLVLRR